MEFHVLGPVRVCSGGRELVVAGRKQRTMLAALLLARGRELCDDELTEVLWGQYPPATLHAQIYTYASRLRARLAPAAELARRPWGYRISIDAGSVDVDEFERLTAEGRAALAAGHCDRAAATLRAALALWRGPALGGVTDFLRDAELPRLQEARMAALENRIDAELALGQHALLVAELTGLVGRHPLRERLRAQLMTALHRCERRAEALAVYDEGRRILGEKLGVDPGRTLRATHRAVLAGDAAAPRC